MNTNEEPYTPTDTPYTKQADALVEVAVRYTLLADALRELSNLPDSESKHWHEYRAIEDTRHQTIQGLTPEQHDWFLDRLADAS